jgi:membrane protein YdbS with pleckstrin-like domain
MASGASVASIRSMPAPSQRRALGALFLLLAVAFAGIAFAAGTAREWIIVAAAAAIAVWMAGLAARGLRP